MKTLGYGRATLAIVLLVAACSLAADPSDPNAIAGPARTSGPQVGDVAPDFQLEPVEISADFERWLGDKAPQRFQDTVMLSDFVGKAPVVLVFGSFT